MSENVVETSKTLEQLGWAGGKMIEIGCNDTLLLYNFRADQNFDFICLEYACQVLGMGGAPDGPIQYAVIFEGSSAFDGIRHLYFGAERTDNYGYLNYPNMPVIIKALAAIDAFTLESCEYARTARAEDEANAKQFNKTNS